MGTGFDESCISPRRPMPGRGRDHLRPLWLSVYDIAARRCGATPVVAPDADYGTDVDALLALVTIGRAWSSWPTPTTPPAASCPAAIWPGCTRRCLPTCCW
jgi:hypothetical protein